MKEKVDELFKNHDQRGDWSCSASAHEFMAKLHGKVPASDYPLQSDAKAAHKAGFQFESFLNEHGFTGHDESLPPADAVKRFENETAEKRFPLVSLVGTNIEGKPAAHIVVAVPVENGVALADPGKKTLITKNSDETRAVLENVSKAIPDRPNIHCLFYKEK
jgi:CRISPR/Cas system-associated protein endoribonuclease Cas2